MLTDSDISPGNAADKAAIDVARGRATVEGQEDIVEASRLDAHGAMMGDAKRTGDTGGYSGRLSR